MSTSKFFAGLLFLIFCMHTDLYGYCMQFSTSYDLFFASESTRLMLLYKQLFPASFTAQMYENMKRLIYVDGQEEFGLNTQISTLLQNDCALKFCYSNGQPTFQFCILF